MDNVQITCSFLTESSLHAAYMPFIKGGGLFIRTESVYQLGTVIHLSLLLMNEKVSYDIESNVVWITPKGAQSNKPPGIGVQFLGENSSFLHHKIETYLAAVLKSSQVTDTL